MPPIVSNSVISLPFIKAIKHFRDKINIPTERWNDLWKGAHAKGFMVAGAMKTELLADFREAVDKAIVDGTTLKEFQSDFDNIVAKHGWSYNGNAGWRASIIYGTNLRTSYAAGRWKQLTDPEVLKLRPYFKYVHGDSKNPRIQHMMWHGLVLPADDPWWETHYTPNGWGCKCRVFSASKRDLEEMGKDGPDQAPPLDLQPWKDPKTGEKHLVPKGIDPGWDYNVGKVDNTYSVLAKRLESLEPGLARNWMSSIIQEPAFERFFQGKIDGVFPVAVLKPQDKAIIGRKTQTVWLSQESLKAHIKKHPEIRIDDYRKIPEIVDTGEVYKGKQLRLIYLKLDDVLYKAILKRTVKGDENYFLSLFRVTEKKAEISVRNKLERIR